MSIITEVRFGHEDGALADTLEALPEVEVTVVGEAGTDPQNEFYVFRFDAEGTTDVGSVLGDDHTVLNADRMTGFEDELWEVQFTPGTALMAPRVTAAEGFVLDARSANGGTDPRGWHERWLLPDREALQDIWRVAREEGFEFEVLDFREHGRTDPAYPGREVPTEQQREALVVAYEKGYFTEPRETSLEELAEELAISPTAVGGRIKRGMKSLIGMTVMGVERSDPEPRE